jgi:hypothetical protein
LLLSNTHDGSSSLRVYFTTIRVVCQNTLNLAEHRGQGQGIAILHKGDLPAKIQEAQRMLGLAERFFDDAAAKIDIWRRITQTTCSSKLISNRFIPIRPTETTPGRSKPVNG